MPEIVKQMVNGKNGLGAVVGRFCMDLAIEKAKIVGVGWVCVNHSNHYGSTLNLFRILSDIAMWLHYISTVLQRKTMFFFCC